MTESIARHDYVSTSFQKIYLDHCFPNMRVGNADQRFPSYLRRHIPHLCYVDCRNPSVNFVSRDEAHILYNTALELKGKSALEIGCWLGWSTAHLAAGGVVLDVVDPALFDPVVYESVEQSLCLAGVRSNVNLHPGYSPKKVEEIALQTNRRWSLIFIDGNCESPAPLQDTRVVERYAAEDCLVLFHNLVLPSVAEGLNYLKDRGWKTMIYQTMQIMGVAWRGNVRPVDHMPDPNVHWTLPEHLGDYCISGFDPVMLQDWKTGLPKDVMNSIQRGSLAYSYKGIPTTKNPFDIALYPLLIWQVKPRTIIEIGSYCGGSALWLGDILSSFGLGAHIYSIDVNRVTSLSHPKVTYLRGNGRELEAILSPFFLSRLPRPLLVIEDADHQYETTIKVLEFFHQHLLPGEYIIIEDAIVSDMGEDILYNGGPKRAVREFLSKYPDRYEIDRSYCDFFGSNFTWCVNSYLKKKNKANQDLDFQVAYEALGLPTLSKSEYFLELYLSAKKICQEDIPGNFVEYGKGGSSALLAWVIRHHSHRPRKVYVLFEENLDKEADKASTRTDESLQHLGEKLEVGECIIPVTLSESNLAASLKEVGEVALLYIHANGDYKSTINALRNLYSQVSSKGLIQIEGYGLWESCRQAVHDFEQEIQSFFHIHIIDHTGAWFTPGENNPILLSQEKPSFPVSRVCLGKVSLALFPDWDPSFQEATISSLELLLEFILLSPIPQDYALIVSAELDYGMAESILETAAANVTLKLTDSGYELKEEPSISLVKTLNSEQWKRLLAQVNYHYPLAHEQIPAGIRPALDRVPRFELPSR
ncbi:class I SAM-dependent methyltransferase [Synechococcus sp. H55.9]|uniref:class I SAM-dependent methyltransferase n=1 Tax=Synechococcus sp. H55.9 TaxID=2964511 RepID=UPI0039C011CE